MKNLTINTYYRLLQRHDPNCQLSADEVFVADWSDVPDYLEGYIDYHHTTAWSDTSILCSNCYNHISTDYQGDSYYQFECDVICETCMEEFPDDVIEDAKFYADSLPVYPKALPYFMKSHLESAKFAPFNSEHALCKDTFTSGMHKGQTDSPHAVAKLITETLGPLTEVIFLVDSSTPFQVDFSAYVKVAEEDTVSEKISKMEQTLKAIQEEQQVTIAKLAQKKAQNN